MTCLITTIYRLNFPQSPTDFLLNTSYKSSVTLCQEVRVLLTAHSKMALWRERANTLGVAIFIGLLDLALGMMGDMGKIFS